MSKYELCEVSSDEQGIYMKCQRDCGCQNTTEVKRETNLGSSIVVSIILILSVVAITMFLNGVFFK